VADPPGGLEDGHRYILVRVEEMDDTQSQRDEMFAKIRNEIGGIERRIKEFNAMVDELVRMVGTMQETERVRQAAMAGGGGLQIRADGLMNGFWIRSATSATRMPPYPAREPPTAAHASLRSSPRRHPLAPLGGRFQTSSGIRLFPVTITAGAAGSVVGRGDIAPFFPFSSTCSSAARAQRHPSTVLPSCVPHLPECQYSRLGATQA
jgi:hypothetical protein